MFKRLFLILLVLLSASFSSGQGFVASGNRTVDTRHQDQYTRALDLRFVQAQAPPTTLTSPTVVDAYELTLDSTIGFVDGSYVLIAETGSRFYLGTQMGAPVGKTITVDAPLDKIYPSGSTVLSTSYDMVVDGSLSPEVFQIGSTGLDTELDITRILGYFLDTDSMDDSKFGSLPALTSGCILRLSNGENTNLWTVKSNGDFALLGYDFSYPPKPPAGKNSARFRITYAGQDKHGVTLRLEAGDVLEFIIQDDLTGLEVFNMMAQGHVVD